MKVFDLEAWLAERARRVETALRACLDAGEGTAWPEPLGRAMTAGTSGGKRLRAAIVLAAADAVGSKEPPLGAACAVELVHCYSLIHDDLPSMDDAAERRGEPTVHRVSGEAAAILAGDALLALAFEVLAREGVERGRPAEYLDAVRELGRAAGPRGMVGGQAIDLAQKQRPPSTLRELELCHGAKTAAMFSAAAAIGARVGGGSADETQVLRGYGFDLGLAFQHADDLDDREHLALAAEARRRTRELGARATRAVERFGAAAQPLQALVERVVRPVVAVEKA